MIILHDPLCAEYGSHMRPEQPARVLRSAAHLQAAHPAWTWQKPAAADEKKRCPPTNVRKPPTT